MKAFVKVINVALRRLTLWDPGENDNAIMNLLLDTNIFVPLEPAASSSMKSFASFVPSPLTSGAFPICESL